MIADVARPAASGGLPNFLIIGAMRSGTTSLARYLGAHPDVFVAQDKELHFFDLNRDRGLDWYRAQFTGAEGERMVGEATQTYMYDGEAVDRMASDLPDAKLIAILRDPVKRAYSHYWQNHARGTEPLSFPDAIAAEPERLASSDKQSRFFFSYVDRGLYVRQLRRICEHYPRASLHVLLFEDLRDAPAEAYRSACAFLGVDDDFLPPNIGVPINRYVSFRSVKLRALGKKLPRALRRAVGRLNTQEASYPPMDPGVRAELRQRFAADNAALETWLDRDLSEWRRR